MGRRLLTMESDQTGFSPFVDVSINAMAAIFIFLVIYVAVVRPRPIPPLEILTESLPRPAWTRPYEAAIVVTGGQPPYHFTVVDPVDLDAVRLSLDPRTGRIAGTPMLATAKQMAEGREIVLTVEVSDQFGRSAKTGHPLRLEIAPMVVPFDPEKERLRFAATKSRLPDAFVGRKYSAAVPVLGGLEPYDVTDVSDLPPGLRIERATGCIQGIPEEVAVPEGTGFQEYTLRVRVADQQSAKLPEPERRPRPEGDFILRVYRVAPIVVSGPLPPSARAGLEYRGALVASGGYGKYKWSAGTPRTNGAGHNFRTLTQLGLTVDAATGVLQGRVPAGLTSGNHPLRVTVPLLVDDDDATSDPVQWDMDLLILPPMQFLKPQ